MGYTIGSITNMDFFPAGLPPLNYFVYLLKFYVHFSRSP